ncbi:hypothetical protein BP00DRAFT_367241 [Aspergillus indologenus CBS 114.80]|uniref:Protein kinase domain-containing protein n=1 Tax=Aspergillus indologenus CBS 114.80 TaxID=1450541 RepID=A0A2V5IB41_9EURO|nr:hypothetical protein BP00DRAFT_367241 [Aspergillus indologenus CBS 114.80]
MCFLENPSPVYFAKCKHTVDDPEEPTPRMCPVAQNRTPPSWCPDPPKPTSKGSSTNRVYLSMILFKIRTWIYQIYNWLCKWVWPHAARISDDSRVSLNRSPKLQNSQRPAPGTDDAKPGSSSNAQAPRTDTTTEPTIIRTNSDNSQLSPTLDDPYLGLPVISIGMTGVIHELGQDRVVKKAKQHHPGRTRDLEDTEYLNQINRETLQNEVEVYKRLGRHPGIIPCYRTSKYGIELARAQGDLESRLNEYPEREDTAKLRWIISLVESFAYIHSCRVFVDDIALRNILIMDEELKVADFGQSILLPRDAVMGSITENDLNAKIEILHLGWIIYSIASWQVHKYYFFSPENPDLCWPASFPDVEGMLCGAMIKKCWQGKYSDMEQLKDEARHLLAGQ